MRLRTAKDRLKIEHSIIDGVRPILEELLVATPVIRSIIPGVIRPVGDDAFLHVIMPMHLG